ncbi:MAG: translation elongation factor-like protein [Armatimonadota bacterium]|nr:translation elongation factor-like protein [Armatimonadota bacterium]
MERQVGHVTHYFSHLGVAAVQVETEDLKLGDQIHIKGHTTDLIQPVDSLQYEHGEIKEAHPGQSVGIRVKEHVREHDVVFKVAA